MYRLDELIPGDCFSFDGAEIFSARSVAFGIRVQLSGRKYIILQSNDNEIRFACYNFDYPKGVTAIYYLDLNDELDSELSKLRRIKLITPNCMVSQLILASRLRYNKYRFKELYHKKIDYNYE